MSTAAAADPRSVRARESVLAAATDLMTEVGLAGMTVEAIALRSGVAKTTIYRHWPEPSRLVIDAIERLAEPCAEPDTGTLRGDLEVIVQGLARTLTRSPLSKAMASLVDAAERDAEVARLQRAWVRQRRSATTRALERARARGEIDGAVDAEVAVAMFAGALFYRRLVSHESLGPAFLRQVVDATLRMLDADRRSGRGSQVRVRRSG